LIRVGLLTLLLSGAAGCSWLLGIDGDPVEVTDAGDDGARDARAADGPFE
jgi:hypothetical protein